MLNRFLYLLNSLNKTLKKILENGKKILEKSGKNQGNLSVRKCGNHGLVMEVLSVMVKVIQIIT